MIDRAPSRPALFRRLQVAGGLRPSLRALFLALVFVCGMVPGAARASNLGDLDSDCIVGSSDVALVLANWGPCELDGPCDADLNGDGQVNAFDLALLLGNWGQRCARVTLSNCPNYVFIGGTFSVSAFNVAPPGGTYAWSLVQPGAQLSIIGPPTDVFVTVRGDNASAAVGDVKIRCTYTKGAFSATADCVVTAVALRPTAIKFDYKGPDTDPGDALNIRASRADDLKHEGNGKGDGEWLRALGAAGPTRNEPCLYIAGVKPKLQAKLEVRPKTIASIKAGAFATGGIFAGLTSKTVNFDANGVSTDGAGGAYIEFEYAVASPVRVSKGVGTFEWTGGITVDGAPQEVTADITGPHTMYHVLETPRSPWYDTAKQHPWADALDFAIDTSKGNADGRTTLTAALSEITFFIHSRTGGGYGLRYDTVSGGVSYVGKINFVTGVQFDLAAFISAAHVARVNCHDVACAVQSLGALMGARTQYVYMTPFGYIPATFLVGITGNANPVGAVDMNPAGTVNNPFPRNDPGAPGGNGMLTPGNTGDNDDHRGLAAPHRRRPYGNHGFCEIMNATLGDERMFDACVGPHLGTENRVDYVANGVDSDTAAERMEGATRIAGEATDIRPASKVIIDFTK